MALPTFVRMFGDNQYDYNNLTHRLHEYIFVFDKNKYYKKRWTLISSISQSIPFLIHAALSGGYYTCLSSMHTEFLLTSIGHYDKGSGIAIEVVSPCHRKSEHVRYFLSGIF